MSLPDEGWKPIESAPKDGTYVLLGGEGMLMIGAWSSRSEAWDDGDYNDHETWPTHWMPLPSPPDRGAG